MDLADDGLLAEMAMPPWSRASAADDLLRLIVLASYGPETMVRPSRRRCCGRDCPCSLRWRGRGRDACACTYSCSAKRVAHLVTTCDGERKYPHKCLIVLAGTDLDRAGVTGSIPVASTIFRRSSDQCSGLNEACMQGRPHFKSGRWVYGGRRCHQTFINLQYSRRDTWLGSRLQEQRRSAWPLACRGSIQEVS
jgi:hypothetical protein